MSTGSSQRDNFKSACKHLPRVASSQDVKSAKVIPLAVLVGCLAVGLQAAPHQSPIIPGYDDVRLAAEGGPDRNQPIGAAFEDKFPQTNLKNQLLADLQKLVSSKKRSASLEKILNGLIKDLHELKSFNSYELAGLQSRVTFAISNWRDGLGYWKRSQALQGDLLQRDINKAMKPYLPPILTRAISLREEQHQAEKSVEVRQKNAARIMVQEFARIYASVGDRLPRKVVQALLVEKDGRGSANPRWSFEMNDYRTKISTYEAMIERGRFFLEAANEFPKYPRFHLDQQADLLAEATRQVKDVMTNAKYVVRPTYRKLETIRTKVRRLSRSK
jgi:hypothetical protein